MRILFASTPGIGHIHPLVPIALAARGAGHDVRVAAPSSAATVIEHCGLTHVAAGEGRPMLEVLPELGALRGAQLTATIVRRWFAGHAAARMAADLLDLCARWRPDVVVHESAAHGASIAAERLDLPHVVVETSLVGTPSSRRERLRDPLTRLRALHGLPADPDLRMPTRYAVFVPFPPSLRAPGYEMPATAHFVRPVPFDRSGDEGLPTWLAASPPRPLVYATLGTTWWATERADLYRHIADGLHDDAATVEVTIGRGGDPTQYAESCPSNVRFERYIPQSLLFSRCDLVVTHGGSGTLVSALAHGLPSVVIPLAADQPDNAGRIEALGLGRSLSENGLTPDDVRVAVADVLGSPHYRRNAEAVQAEIQAMDGPDDAIRLLEQLAIERTPIHRRTIVNAASHT